jgi:hypothetical protein
MHDDNQIIVPPSFIALFSDTRGRLQAAQEQVRLRYELCEDLACHLVEQAQTLYHSGSSSEEGVLHGIHTGLATEGSVVSVPEAGWIIQRLAELLEWRAPPLPGLPSPP